MESLKAKILEELLEIKAITINPKDPFIYASGIHSPIYTDLRQTISYPELRENIAKGLTAMIKDSFPEVMIIGGVATAGIPHASWVAQLAKMPMIYVRSKPKDHGAGKQIEGCVSQKDQVVLIDDLISTGGSVLKAAQAVQKSGANVAGVVSIFSYGLKDADHNFERENITLKSLLSFQDLLDFVQEHKLLTSEEINLVEQWQQNPWDWH